MGQLVQYETISGYITGCLFNQSALPEQSVLTAWAAKGISASLEPDAPILNGGTGIYIGGVYTPYAPTCFSAKH